MPHEISTASGKVEMAYAGDIRTPWWTKAGFAGNHLGDTPVTSAEMITAAGQAWETRLVPVFAQMDDIHGNLSRETLHPDIEITAAEEDLVLATFDLVPIENRRAIVRSDTGDIFNVMSHNWEPIQNVDAFEFFDGIVGEGQAHYVSAGCLGRGQRVWILARLPETLTIAGNEIEEYILLTNGHDGSSSFQFQPTAVQVVCQNTYNVALMEAAGKQTTYRRYHFRGVNQTLDARDAAQIIGLAGTYYEHLAREADKLVKVGMTGKQIDTFLAGLFPLPALPAPNDPRVLALPEPDPARWMEKMTDKHHKRRDEIKLHIKEGRGQDDINKTAWGVFSGLAEWVDHDWVHEKTAASSIVAGAGRRLKQRAWNTLRG